MIRLRCGYFCQAEDGIRALVRSRGLGDVYKRQASDRPLDMLRTTVNVTGDAMIATIIAKSESKLGE